MRPIRYDRIYFHPFNPFIQMISIYTANVYARPLSVYVFAKNVSYSYRRLFPKIQSLCYYSHTANFFYAATTTIEKTDTYNKVYPLRARTMPMETGYFWSDYKRFRIEFRFRSLMLIQTTLRKCVQSVYVCERVFFFRLLREKFDWWCVQQRWKETKFNWNQFNSKIH